MAVGVAVAGRAAHVGGQHGVAAVDQVLRQEVEPRPRLPLRPAVDDDHDRRRLLPGARAIEPGGNRPVVERRIAHQFGVDERLGRDAAVGHVGQRPDALAHRRPIPDVDVAAAARRCVGEGQRRGVGAEGEALVVDAQHAIGQRGAGAGNAARQVKQLEAAVTVLIEAEGDVAAVGREGEVLQVVERPDDRVPQSIRQVEAHQVGAVAVQVGDDVDVAAVGTVGGVLIAGRAVSGAKAARPASGQVKFEQVVGGRAAGAGEQHTLGRGVGHGAVEEARLVALPQQSGCRAVERLAIETEVGGVVAVGGEEEGATVGGPLAGDVHDAVVAGGQAGFDAGGRVDLIEVGVFIAAAVAGEEDALVAGRGGAAQPKDAVLGKGQLLRHGHTTAGRTQRRAPRLRHASQVTDERQPAAVAAEAGHVGLLDVEVAVDRVHCVNRGILQWYRPGSDTHRTPARS